jgi:hypothetical protein
LSTGWFAGFPHWTPEEIAADASAARSEFRARRLGEPVERYLRAFDASHPHLAALIGALRTALTGGADGGQLLKQLWASEEGRTAFRYLGAPPISEDDLETLAETRFNATATGDVQGRLERLLGVMRAIVDPRRFPWVAEGRDPTPHEVDAAVLASTTLTASQRVQALRRGDEKSMVEGSVKGLLVGLGWQAAQRPAGGIQNLLKDSPPARTFLTQINLGGDNADVVVRLDDGRLLAIECKGSNSEINSRKRLNKEAVQNARAWLQGFGTQQVVPAVALQGVFNPRYVIDAQNTPMAVFWAHRLDDLRRAIAPDR